MSGMNLEPMVYLVFYLFSIILKLLLNKIDLDIVIFKKAGILNPSQRWLQERLMPKYMLGMNMDMS